MVAHPPRKGKMKMTKRENGSGSIVRRKLANGIKYVAYAPAKYETIGDQVRLVRQKIGSYDKKSDARAALDDFLKHPSSKYNYTKDSFLRTVWQPCMAALGLPDDLTPHSARHTCGTRLSAAGVPAEDIQRILGHADYSMTANVYINQDVDTLRASIERVG